MLLHNGNNITKRKQERKFLWLQNTGVLRNTYVVVLASPAQHPLQHLDTWLGSSLAGCSLPRLIFRRKSRNGNIAKQRAMKLITKQ